MTDIEIGDSAYDWDESDQIDEAQKKNAAARAERAKAYAHVFGHEPMGQKILAEWVNMYCTGAPPGPDATVRQTGMRDGKQELVAMIIQQIQIASGEL